MAKQNLNIGSAANDGTGDSLRDGAIKLNSVINELYTALGNDTNLQINIDSPTTGQLLKWNGSLFTEGSFNSLTENLDVNDQNITSSDGGDVVLKPHSTGDIKLWAGGTGSALTYIDGADGKLKYSNFFSQLSDLPDVSTHHGMFAHVHDEAHGYFAHSSWIQLLDTGSSIGELSDVDMTVGGGPSAGQVLKWNGTDNRWEPGNDATADGGGGGTTQNLFETVNADSGSTTASAATDTLTIAGGTLISTEITGDTVTINMTGSLGDPDQNLFSVVGSDSGSKTANSTTTTINFIGGTGISTAISGDNLTITNDSPNADQNIFATVSGDSGGSTTADATNATLTVAGGTGVSTAITSNTVTVNAEVAFASAGTPNANTTLIADENGMYYKAPSPTVGFTVSAFGSTAYTFEGGGVNSSTNNPTLYVYRGFTYRFNNTATSAHPFALRTSNGGGAVSGVAGSQSGVQYWTVPMALAAGTTYVYQCTIHSGMVGNIVVV